MQIIVDTLHSTMWFFIYSIPFIFINLFLQKIIYKSKINNISIIFNLGLIASIVFVVGITCYYGVNFNTLDVSNLFSKNNLNLNLFSTIKSFLFLSFSGDIRALLNLFGNIVIFFPIGFFLSGVLNNKNHLKIKISLICYFVSLLIEIFQVLVNRNGDIDDIVLNTLGGYLGCIIWYMFDNIFDLSLKIKKEKISIFQNFLYYSITIINWSMFFIGSSIFFVM